MEHRLREQAPMTDPAKAELEFMGDLKEWLVRRTLPGQGPVEPSVATP